MQQYNLSTLKSRISLVLRRFHHQPLDLYAYSDGHMDLLRRSKIFSKGINYDSSISSLHTHIFSNRFVRTSAVMAIFALVLLTSAILVPLYNKLDITEAATGTAKESSLSFNLTNSTASVDLSVNNSNGTFASSSDDNSKVKFNISTTNYTGYTLSIKGSNSTRQLVNSTNSSYTLSSISSTTSSNDFSEDSTSAGDNYNGKWGYLPSKLNSSTNSKYQPAPTTSATTLNKTDCANGSSTCNGNNGVSGGDSYTISIGARASYTTPAGEYTGTYILTAVGNPINYTVTYNKNTTDTVSSLPSNVDSSTSETNVSLSTTVPTREGYTFIGWCSVATTTNANGIDECSGTTYTTGDNYGIDQTTTNNTTLYAMWEKNAVNELANFTYMQDVTTTACNNTAVGQTATVKDNRDNTTYTIGKLADGNCWLLDNLALDLTDSAIQANLSSATTNATNFELSYLTGARIGTASNKYAITGVSVWTSSSSYASSYSYSDPLYQMSGKCNTSNKYCVTNTAGGNWSYTSTTGSANDGADKYPGKVGAYYNYCAATAGTYCYGSGTSYGSPSGNASADICPYGWRLPTGGSSGEFQALYTAYGSNYANFRSALQVPLSGNFIRGVANYQGNTGYFWSSTYNSADGMYTLLVGASNVAPASYYSRNGGRSVRCVLDQRTIADVTYMQDVTSTVVANTADLATATLTDRRDNKTYTVKKINGQLWMVQNLRFTETVIDADSTNYAGNTTLTYYDLETDGGIYNTDGACYGKYTSSSNYSGGGYSNACIKDSGDATIGVWYNYAAATARTVTGTPYVNSNTASWDICPQHWHLPTGPNQTEGTDFNKLFGNTTTSWQTTPGIEAFDIVAGGIYTNGSLSGSGRVSLWWSASPHTVNGSKLGAYRTILNYDANYGADGSNGSFRQYGLFVRCVFGG